MKTTDYAIRPEVAEDAVAIDKLLHLAFKGDYEARLVAALRTANKLVLTLVAEATDSKEILGHIAFSEMLPSLAEQRIFGIAPLAVLPIRQSQGIGSALIRAGLEAAHRLGATHAALLGEPAYYSRFGFLPARQFGITNEWTDSEAFMIFSLGDIPVPRDIALQYQPEFSV